MEWIKSDSAEDTDKGGSASPQDDGKAVKMNSSEWQESIDKLLESSATQKGEMPRGRLRPAC